MVIRMIRFLIVINLAIGLLAGCSERSQDEGHDVSVSGEAEGGNAPDPIKDLEEQGRLPTAGGGGKVPGLPLEKSAISLYPPEVDSDQDNVPDQAIAGRPDIPVDNCPGLFNPDQEDADEDGVGDSCEK